MTSTNFTVALHVGVHKTATSHLQQSLWRAEDMLVENGVRFYGPKYFRLPGRALPALFGLKPGRAPRRPPQEQLELLRKGAGRLVLSEENYIGHLHLADGPPMLARYPEAGKRIGALAQAMDCGGLEVFIGLRDPAAYLNSAYGQMLLGGQVMPMEQFKAQNPLDAVNWLDLVRRIRQAPGVRNVTVWRQEDYAKVFDQVVSGLTGLRGVVKPLSARIHVGLSAPAVAAVLAGSDQRPRDLREALPVGPDHPPFDGMSVDEHASAAAAYATQIDGIARLDGVTLLEPPGCS